MSRLRSILSIVLVFVTIFLVSCGSPKASIPTTYSPEKIEQLQVLIEPVTEAREKMSVLKDLIADQNWIDVQTYIHGPLGGLRQQLRNLSTSLLPKDQKPATDLAKELFNRLERLDAAAKERSISGAEAQFRQAVRDFDAYLDLLPKGS
ncbi:photosystem II protein PsbQ [Rippkaea orientalis PCC 8801]|uniref:Photosystem II protein PsbQ n=1 Tax=Rippkaea orientalis (strain PCC 8801 / RF-1) TaxID=41431 RepID=B7JZZ5_RIPO1|nr:photosystem II protein PsbQ [Rippkaea orientalis]ACK66142.1 photosystem II protein PsbQ [Rippkaea orientalis PCC 8801]